MQNFNLAADFWNCQCADAYVHRLAVNDCPRCGATRDGAERPTVDEVAVILNISRDEIRRIA